MGKFKSGLAILVEEVGRSYDFSYKGCRYQGDS